MSEQYSCVHCCHIRSGASCARASAAFPFARRCNLFELWGHVSGCGFCTHMRGNQCTHPANGAPLDYHEARQRGRPCGPGAQLWERYGYEDWDASVVADKLEVTL
jgi:hypothetical protein